MCIGDEWKNTVFHFLLFHFLLVIFLVLVELVMVEEILDVVQVIDTYLNVMILKYLTYLHRFLIVVVCLFLVGGVEEILNVVGGVEEILNVVEMQ